MIYFIYLFNSSSNAKYDNNQDEINLEHYIDSDASMGDFHVLVFLLYIIHNLGKMSYDTQVLIGSFSHSFILYRAGKHHFYGHLK